MKCPQCKVGNVVYHPDNFFASCSHCDWRNGHRKFVQAYNRLCRFCSREVCDSAQCELLDQRIVMEGVNMGVGINEELDGPQEAHKPGEDAVRKALCSCNACGKPLSSSKSGETACMLCWRCQFDSEIDCSVCRLLVEKIDENWSHGCGRCGRSREELLAWANKLGDDDNGARLDEEVKITNIDLTEEVKTTMPLQDFVERFGKPLYCSSEHFAQNWFKLYDRKGVVFVYENNPLRHQTFMRIIAAARRLFKEEFMARTAFYYAPGMKYNEIIDYVPECLDATWRAPAGLDREENAHGG